MGLFDKVRTPIFLKNVPDINEDVVELEKFLEVASDDEKENLKAEIKKYEYGHKGEKAIEFELKHAGIPMIIIPNLYLQHNELSAQIDFLVLTRNSNYIIECKNLYGDVHIGNNGEFFRKIAGKTQKIYSPFTQCQRHSQVIREIRFDTKNNMLTKYIFEKNFKNSYKPLVVFANSNCKINTKYAPEDIASQIVGVDQLVAYFQKNDNPREYMQEKQFIELGDFFLSANKENPKKYLDKYKTKASDNSKTICKIPEDIEPKEILNEEVTEEISPTENESQEKICTRCGSPMILREAKRGDNKGNQFYGCSSYPKCRNIENI